MGRGGADRAAARSSARPARAARLAPAVVTNPARRAPVDGDSHWVSFGRIDLLLDVLNLLNDAAEESLATETLMTETVFSPTFGQPASFMDPRRVMVGVRLNLGRKSVFRLRVFAPEPPSRRESRNISLSGRPGIPA